MKTPNASRPFATACAALAVVLAVTAGSPRVIAQTPPGSAPGAAAGAPLTPEAIDQLVAPIALYPDALILQIVQCASSPYQVKQVNDWLKQNPDLKGTAAQDAASKQGFDVNFVAIVLFPQVLEMMADKPDWTRDLGQAFVTNRDGVLASVQRLRAKAKAVGNLQSNERQDVQTVTGDGGQQVIVIQPANPQVVYVPQYNPTVVYTQPVTTTTTTSNSGQVVAAGLIGFAAGVIVGAAVDDDHDNYYYACGGWGYRGAACYPGGYNDYYRHRENMANDYYDHRENMAGQRGQNQSNRQDTWSQNQSNRQDNRASTRDTASQNQSNRAANRSSTRDTASQNRGENQANRQSAAQSNWGSRDWGANASQSASRTGQARSGYTGNRSAEQRSGAFSGYQRGSTERASSSRGSQSMSRSGYSGGSRGGGGYRGGGGGRGGRR